MGRRRTERNRHDPASGFTAVETAVVLVVVASVLLIVTPGLIQWYWRQRFFQTVEQVVAALRLAQFSAISTGRWMAVVVYKDCPDSLQLRQRPSPVNVLACIARFRLPTGSCGLQTADWNNITGDYTTAVPACCPAGGGTNCVDLVNPGLCEYVGDFWLAPISPRVDIYFGGPNVEVFVVSPEGAVARQVPPSGTNDPTGGQCSEMMGPDVWRIEALPASGLPLIDDDRPTLQMFLQFPMGDPRLFRGVCLSGGGRVGWTNPALTPDDLNCS